MRQLFFQYQYSVLEREIGLTRNGAFLLVGHLAACATLPPSYKPLVHSWGLIINFTRHQVISSWRWKTLSKRFIFLKVISQNSHRHFWWIKKEGERETWRPWWWIKDNGGQELSCADDPRPEDPVHRAAVNLPSKRTHDGRKIVRTVPQVWAVNWVEPTNRGNEHLTDGAFFLWRVFIYLGLAPSDGPRPYGPCFVEAGEDLGDAAVGDEQLTGNVAGTDAQQRQLHDAATHAVGQGTSVHEDAAQLVHARLAWKRRRGETNQQLHFHGQLIWITRTHVIFINIQHVKVTKKW